jgi:hypothetical protein
MNVQNLSCSILGLRINGSLFLVGYRLGTSIFYDDDDEWRYTNDDDSHDDGYDDGGGWCLFCWSVVIFPVDPDEDTML